MVIKVVGNFWYGYDIMCFFFVWDEDLVIFENVVKVVVGNGGNGYEIMFLFFEKWGKCLLIFDEVVKVV